MESHLAAKRRDKSAKTPNFVLVRYRRRWAVKWEPRGRGRERESYVEEGRQRPDLVLAAGELLQQRRQKGLVWESEERSRLHWHSDAQQFAAYKSGCRPGGRGVC